MLFVFFFIFLFPLFLPFWELLKSNFDLLIVFLSVSFYIVFTVTALGIIIDAHTTYHRLCVSPFISLTGPQKPYLPFLSPTTFVLNILFIYIENHSIHWYYFCFHHQTELRKLKKEILLHLPMFFIFLCSFFHPAFQRLLPLSSSFWLEGFR